MSSGIRNLVTAIMMLGVVACCGSAAHAQGESPQSQSTPTIRAGFLTCQVASGWGFVFGSSRKVNCTYEMEPNHTEYYRGTISKFGADIGYLHSAVLLWSVLAP